MYPYIIVSHNIERNTMIGKLIIPGFEIDPYDHFFIDEEIYDNSEDDESDDELTEEPEVLRKYDAGRDFVEGYLTGDILSFGNRWFNLPSYDTLLRDFKSEFNIKPRKRIIMKRIFSKIKEVIKIDA